MAEPLRLLADRLRTPVGTLLVVEDAAGVLRAVDWVEDEARLRRRLAAHYGATGVALAAAPHGLAATAALDAYFAGTLGAIDAIPVATGGTAFQRAVWAALREIPCGATRSYGEIARRIGNPAACRAVGLANNRNPIGIVVPCHRVVGADGSLTGYGGGMDRKRWLLAHEGATLRRAVAAAC